MWKLTTNSAALHPTDVQTKAKHRLWREPLAWLTIAVGIAGCVLPFIPGLPLILVGLALLAQDYAWAKTAIGKVKRWWVSLRRWWKKRKNERA